MADAVAVNVKFDKDIGALYERAGLGSVYAMGKALDEVGNKTKTQTMRAVAAQAGVKYGAVKGVVSSRQAMGAGSGQYEIIARGATLSLKEFAPRQTAKGVSAAPWGKRRVFPHTFIGPGGHIFARKGKSRLPIHKLFGPAIPKEMVKDEAERTFYRVSGELLGPAVEKWLLRQLG
jgi:hypothetical protein